MQTQFVQFSSIIMSEIPKTENRQCILYRPTLASTEVEIYSEITGGLLTAKLKLARSGSVCSEEIFIEE